MRTVFPNRRVVKGQGFTFFPMLLLALLKELQGAGLGFDILVIPLLR
jgi:hypothetical protein